MATLLTNSRMAPALARRIEASVRGGRRAASGAVTLRRFASLFRLIVVAMIAVTAVAFLRLRRQVRDELTRSREALLAAIHARASTLAPEELRAVSRIEPWLLRGSGAYEGDLVGSELAEPGAFAALLSRPIVYVRGVTSELGGPAQIATVAASSVKDAFVLCLLEPPEPGPDGEIPESAFLKRVHGAYGGGARLEARTANVRRLHEAEAALSVLAPSWERQVRAAEDLEGLARLEKAFRTAPMDRGLEAAKARLLLYALDEPVSGPGLSELDGERAHDVRVGLVDLGRGTVLLRLRRHVDPSWISPAKRPEYASGLDSCRLAVDVRTSVGKR